MLKGSLKSERQGKVIIFIFTIEDGTVKFSNSMVRTGLVLLFEGGPDVHLVKQVHFTQTAFVQRPCDSSVCFQQG